MSLKPAIEFTNMQDFVEYLKTKGFTEEQIESQIEEMIMEGITIRKLPSIGDKQEDRK